MVRARRSAVTLCAMRYAYWEGTKICQPYASEEQDAVVEYGPNCPPDTPVGASATKLITLLTVSGDSTCRKGAPLGTLKETILPSGCSSAQVWNRLRSTELLGTVTGPTVTMAES